MEEDLTKLRNKLYFVIRKSNMTTKCWTIDGRIFAIVKGSGEQGERKLIFSNPDDLSQLGWNKDKVNVFLDADDLSQFVDSS